MSDWAHCECCHEECEARHDEPCEVCQMSEADLELGGATSAWEHHYGV
jgi:hypothetical protein